MLKLTELNMNGVDFDTLLQLEHDETQRNKVHHGSISDLPLQHCTSTDGGATSSAPFKSSAIVMGDETTDEQLAVLGVDRRDWETGTNNDRPKTSGAYFDRGSAKINLEFLAVDGDIEYEVGRHSAAESLLSSVTEAAPVSVSDQVIPEFKTSGQLVEPRRLALTEDLKREVERFHPGLYLTSRMLRYYSTFILPPDHVLSEVPELDGALISLLRNLELSNPDELESGRMLKDLHGKTLRISDALLILLGKLQSAEPNMPELINLVKFIMSMTANSLQRTIFYRRKAVAAALQLSRRAPHLMKDLKRQPVDFINTAQASRRTNGHQAPRLFGKRIVAQLADSYRDEFEPLLRFVKKTQPDPSHRSNDFRKPHSPPPRGSNRSLRRLNDDRPNRRRSRSRSPIRAVARESRYYPPLKQPRDPINFSEADAAVDNAKMIVMLAKGAIHETDSNSH